MDSAGAAESPPPQGRGETDHGWRFFREFGFLTLMALVIAIVIKTFLIQAFFIPSGSMEPTLMPNDRILVNRLAYRFGDIERGDIIVFGIRPHAAGPGHRRHGPALARRGDRRGSAGRRRLHQAGDRAPRETWEIATA
jgi:signal peptidase I